MGAFCCWAIIIPSRWSNRIHLEGALLLLLQLLLHLQATEGDHQSSLAINFYKMDPRGLVYPLQPSGLGLDVAREMELLLLVTGLTDYLVTSWDPDFSRWFQGEGLGATRFETGSMKILVVLLVH